MERRKYEELTEFLEENVFEQWDKQKLKQLEKESKNFKVKHGILYRKTNEKTDIQKVKNSIKEVF